MFIFLLLSSYRRFGTGKRNTNSTSAKQLNYKYDSSSSGRPSTAPSKRGGLAGSKLKSSTGRPMAFEE